MGKHWEEKDVIILKRLYEKGLKDKEIAEHFKTEISRISNKRISLGLFERETQDWNNEDLHKFKKMIQEGVSMIEIAKHFPNRTYSALSSKKYLLGCRSPKQKRELAENSFDIKKYKAYMKGEKVNGSIRM